MSVYGETPNGVVNGSNRVFTTDQPYFAGSTRLFKNGSRQVLGTDYTESAASQITFTSAPAGGAVLLIDYDITASGANYPIGEWTFNPEGYGAGAALYNGPTLFPGGIDPGSTQTAVAVFGPGGARVTIPPVFDGPAGLPPVLNMGAVSPLTAGSSPTAGLELTAPGGPGVASAYELTLGIPRGSDGAAAANTLISPKPADLEGTPTDNYAIGYSTADTKAKWVPLPIMAQYNAVSIAATGTSAGQVRSLTSITIPAQLRPYIPIVLADCVITGTANTQVDLVARAGGTANSQSGTQIARGRGPAGSLIGATPWPTLMIPNFAAVLLAAGAASITSGSQQIWLNCEQQASTSDQYATAAGASFTILLVAVPT